MHQAFSAQPGGVNEDESLPIPLERRVNRVACRTGQFRDHVTRGPQKLVDEAGFAATNNITIDTEGSETIDGAATQTITVNYGSVSIYCENSNWFIY